MQKLLSCANVDDHDGHSTVAVLRGRSAMPSQLGGAAEMLLGEHPFLFSGIPGECYPAQESGDMVCRENVVYQNKMSLLVSAFLH